MALFFLLLVFAAGPCALAQPALKDVFADFKIGAALNFNQFTERDARGLPLIKKHFNTISPENVLKWQVVHPAPDRYNFEPADRYVEFGAKHGMFIVGHTLIWHNQVPAWVFQDTAGAPLSRDALLGRMREHIHTVVGRYKGRIHGWDVVNEALNENGTLRPTPWLKIIGEDYLVKAFQFAHEADPKAELYYNDYSLERGAKRDGAVTLIRRLQEAGVKIGGIGTQCHHKLESPSLEDMDASFRTFAKLGIPILVTELDVDVLPLSGPNRGADVSQTEEYRAKLNPFTAGLPEEVQNKLARRYADIFAVMMRHRKSIGRVTFWGVTDGDSWLNNFPVRGRTNYPLLFDREGKTKPAFDAVVAAARAASAK
ncbi:MAG: endo-1,4-beta-xylanase [Acidobacteria bacterium]|nr:endo-1,4-beta-xylanase [Acidobacteriota bacterium]